jgi:hypothetical protein
MEDMRARIERGDIDAERREAIQVRSTLLTQFLFLHSLQMPTAQARADVLPGNVRYSRRPSG